MDPGDANASERVLAGRTALVTGATGDSAGAVIRALAAAGARLVLTGRSPERLRERVDGLGLDTTGWLAVPADLARAEEVERLWSAIIEEMGGVDILVHLAGGWAGGQRLAEMSEESWDAVLDSNLRSAFLVSRAVLGHMVAQGWGRIVLVGSRAAESPGARQAGYNVAKAGVVALTSSIAQDYARQGVAANCISPSIIDTPDNRGSASRIDPSRFLKPEELAAMIVFLCSEAAAGLSGANIPMYARV